MTSLAKALEPSIRAASLLGPKQAMPAARTASATPEHQRHLGTDHHQVGADITSQGDDLVARGDVDIVLLGQPRGTRITGSNDQPRDLRVSAKSQK